MCSSITNPWPARFFFSLFHNFKAVFSSLTQTQDGYFLLSDFNKFKVVRANHATLVFQRWHQVFPVYCLMVWMKLTDSWDLTKILTVAWGPICFSADSWEFFINCQLRLGNCVWISCGIYQRNRWLLAWINHWVSLHWITKILFQSGQFQYGWPCAVGNDYDLRSWRPVTCVELLKWY